MSVKGRDEGQASGQQHEDHLGQPAPTCRVSVLTSLPAYSGMAGPLSYQCDHPWPEGTLVRVPLGQRETLGIVWTAPEEAEQDSASQEAFQLRPVQSVLSELPPLHATWCQLVTFAARYYQRALGEFALSALPAPLRDMQAVQLQRRLKRLRPATDRTSCAPPLSQPPAGEVAPSWLNLSAEQSQVLEQIRTHAGPFLLFGSTGSGKTEVYMRCVQEVLEQDPQAQVLVMVPEINLTPQLEARFTQRFVPQWGAECVVCLHSGMTPAQRLHAWLSAHMGHARIVLGTRMAVLSSLPRLKLIVVDEEHDPSYKQQEGARYSARDLAVYRGKLEQAKVILGSATPSLESWYHSRALHEGGRYVRLHMAARIAQGSQAAALPVVRRVDMCQQPRNTVFSAPLLAAIQQRIERNEQCMVFLNRRGYAPVLHCAHCGWKSECPHCSAFRVFHKVDRTLRCHHCSLTSAVPRACPACGNLDIDSLGRGTERIEEMLEHLLEHVRRPDGAKVRIMRIDADSTRLKGSLQTQLNQVHMGEVDVLVGTQMIAKGHDFRRITLVAAINPDSALFSSDFRASERLFALLMQSAGRAGRDARFVQEQGSRAEMWVQTYHLNHPLYEALKQHDYPAFAQAELQERQKAGLPPFSYQALVRSEARTQEGAQAFLVAAREQAQGLPMHERVQCYSAVPMSLQRVANVERAQMLVESHSRTALQQFLTAWQSVLIHLRAQPTHRGVLRWAIDVDPQSI